MALDTREAFKLGFLLRCAESGYGPDGLAGTVCAADSLLKRAEGIMGPINSIFKPVANVGVNTAAATLLGIPVGIGALGGYMAHKATEKPIDEEDVKNTEVADEYQRLARIARMNARLKSLRRRVVR